MGYYTNMAGLDLFTVPFRNTQVSRTAAASRPQQPKTKTSQPKSAVSPSQQAKSAVTQSQPVKPKAPAIQAQQPDIQHKSVPEKKAPTVQTGQDKSPEPEKKSQAEAQAPAKELPSAQAQSEPPAKELTMDMSDCTIPAGKPLDALEDAKRKAHEEAEAKRKAEWEAKQLAKKQEREAALEKIKSMSDADIVSASTERVRVDTEKLTRRNMKECVSEHIQTACLEDAAFARQVMLPQKNMVRCFQYINRKAYEYVQDEMKAAGIQPGRDTPCYSSDIPDDLCYHWAEEYFRTMDVKEDKEDEEKFVPKPYAGRTTAGSKGKKTTAKKSPAKKPAEKKAEKKEPADNGQISFMEQLSLESMLAPEKKAG